MLQDGVVVLGVLGCPNLPSSKMSAAAAGPSKMAGVARNGVGVVFAAVRGHGAFEGPLMDGAHINRVPYDR